jgi:fermentation-respiration switch protein FrsA (DUF1100 family)
MKEFVMRADRRVLGILAVTLVACASRTPRETVTTLLPSVQDTTVVLTNFDIGEGRIGTNVFRATAHNTAAQTIPFLVSLRAESPSHGVQTSHYRLLQSGETADLVYEYELPNDGYRLLIAYFGPARSMPTDQDPFPGFSTRQLKRFALFPHASRRDVPAASDGSVRPAQAAEHERARHQLAELLDWDRARAPSVSPRVTGRESVGPYQLETVQIATEPEHSIDLLFIRQDTVMSCRLPTVLYLSGNPPGRMESGIVPGMFLADLGMQVVAIDRRESARHTGRGEYLSATADPVFDARMAIDYLRTRQDVDTARIGVFGFSKGAEEGMFVAVLHPSVQAAVLASRLVDQDSLFQTGAWLPTLYSEDVLYDLELDSLLGNWDALRASITPTVSAAALAAYRKRYAFFDSLNPAVVLPLMTPKPLLLVTGARDRQIVLSGAMALDDRVQTAYREIGMSDRADFLIMPRSDHGMPGSIVEQTGEWFRFRLGAARQQDCR